MKSFNKLKFIMKYPVNLIYSIIYKKPAVLSRESTIDQIYKKNMSISRYGDGELNIMMGVGIKFQCFDNILKERLTEIANSEETNCMICIPNIFNKQELDKMVDENGKWWKKHLIFTKGFWYKKFKKNEYGDSLLSRFYLEYKNKDKLVVESYIKNLKKIWDNRDVLFVEGNKSKLGIGNDLFSNAKTIRRILCPSCNAFDKYEEILNCVLNNSTKSDLIICALGPTATVLSFDLSKNGRQALDLGHIDIEYEWFLCGATSIKNIPGKDTSESNEAYIEGLDIINNVVATIQ